MANRHCHKKLRAEVRRRMARTGETYQQARARLLAEARRPLRRAHVPVADLIAAHYFGQPITLAVIVRSDVRAPLIMHVPSGQLAVAHATASPFVRLLRIEGVQ